MSAPASTETAVVPEDSFARGFLHEICDCDFAANVGEKLAIEPQPSKLRRFGIGILLPMHRTNLVTPLLPLVLSAFKRTGLPFDNQVDVEGRIMVDGELLALRFSRVEEFIGQGDASKGYMGTTVGTYPLLTPKPIEPPPVVELQKSVRPTGVMRVGVGSIIDFRASPETIGEALHSIKNGLETRGVPVDDKIVVMPHFNLSPDTGKLETMQLNFLRWEDHKGQFNGFKEETAKKEEE
jgi:hypothetical protein